MTNGLHAPVFGGRRLAWLAVCLLALVAPSSAAGASSYFGSLGNFDAAKPPHTPVSVDPVVPGDIAPGPAGQLYVTFGAYVQEYSPSGALVRTWGGPGFGDGQFGGSHVQGYAGAIDVGPAGDVDVLDPVLNRVQKFSATGGFLAKWGRNGGDGSAGHGPGEFDGPADLAVDTSGDVFVVDDFADPGEDGHLQTFSSTGVLLARMRSGPGHLAASEDGAVWFRERTVYDYRPSIVGYWRGASLTDPSGFSTVVWDELTPEKRDLSSWGGLAVVGDTVWVGDDKQARLEQYSSTGEFLYACNRPYPLNVGGRLATGPDSTLYVFGSESVERYGPVSRLDQACDPSPPKLRHLRLSPPDESPRSPLLSFELTESAALHVSLAQRVTGRRVRGHCVRRTRHNRQRPACSRIKRLFHWTRNVHGYQTTARLLWQTGTHRLAPGRYRVTVRARDLAGNSSRTYVLRRQIRR